MSFESSVAGRLFLFFHLLYLYLPDLAEEESKSSRLVGKRVSEEQRWTGSRWPWLTTQRNATRVAARARRRTLSPPHAEANAKLTGFNKQEVRRYTTVLRARRPLVKHKSLASLSGKSTTQHCVTGYTNDALDFINTVINPFKEVQTGYKVITFNMIVYSPLVWDCRAPSLLSYLGIVSWEVKRKQKNWLSDEIFHDKGRATLEEKMMMAAQKKRWGGGVTGTWWRDWWRSTEWRANQREAKWCEEDDGPSAAASSQLLEPNPPIRGSHCSFSPFIPPVSSILIYAGWAPVIASVLKLLCFLVALCFSKQESEENQVLRRRTMFPLDSPTIEVETSTLWDLDEGSFTVWPNGSMVFFHLLTPSVICSFPLMTWMSFFLLFFLNTLKQYFCLHDAPNYKCRLIVFCY